MTYPTTDVPIDHCDAAGDDPSLFRADVEQAIQTLNALRQSRGEANGLAPIDGAAKVPIGNLPVGTTAGTVAAGDHTHGVSGAYEPANSNIQAHIAATGNPHGTSAADVGADITTTSTHASPAKASIVNNDELPLLDSAAAFTLRRLPWTNLKAAIKSYADTLYAVVNHTHAYAPDNQGVTNGNSHDHSGGDGAQISYGSLSGTPALGTAALKNVPTAGDATGSQVVLGDDTRLSNARAPTTHSHAETDISAGSVLARLAANQTITGTWTYNGGTLTLSRSGSNLIAFNAQGNQAPTYGTRSAGTKMVLLDTLSATELEYAIGHAPGATWISVPSTGRLDVLAGDGVGTAVITLAKIMASAFQVNVPLQITPASGDAVTLDTTGTGNLLVAKGDVGQVTIDKNGAVISGYTASLPTGLRAANERMQLHSAGNGPSYAATSWGTAATRGSQLVLAHSKSGTVGEHAALSDGDVIGRVQAAGSDGAGFGKAAAIEFRVGGQIGDGIVPGGMRFLVTDQAGNEKTAVQISADNEVLVMGNLRAISQTGIEQTLVDGPVITWDMNAGQNAVVTINGTGRTIKPINLKPGVICSLKIIQGPLGNKTITTWNSISFSGSPPTLATLAGHWDRLVFYSDGGSLDELARALNHSGAFPIPEFSYSISSAAGPVSVQFTDESIGAAFYQWSFGDGTPDATVQNPAHTFPTSGTYTVQLQVSNLTGQSSTISHSVTVNQPVYAQFDVDKITGMAPLTVQTTNTSVGTPTSYDWDFGDGSAHSTAASPSHTYSAAGSYPLKLTATRGADSNSTTRSIIVTAATVVANFTLDKTTGAVALTVQTTNQSTGGTSRVWDFGDGTTSTATSPSKTYSTPGTYTITLTETGPGGTSVKTAIVTATSAALPIPQIKYSTAASKTGALDLNGATFTTTDGIYVFVPNQSNVVTVDFYFDNATPNAPTGTYFRRESIAPYDLMGEVVGQPGVPAPWSPNLLSNNSHTLSVVATMSDASTHVAVATFTVNVPNATTVPQTITSPLGYVRALSFSEEFTDNLTADVDRAKWYANYDGGGTRTWTSTDLVTFPTGYNGYQFWAAPEFNGGGAIAGNLVYNPFDRSVPGVLRIKTQKLTGAQYTAYANWLVSQGHLMPPALWGTGYICTLGKWYGADCYFECEMKLPPNKGAWPAFWSMPFTPAAGQGFRPERDFMEFLGGGTSGPGSAISRQYTTALHLADGTGQLLYHKNIANLSDGTWHKFAYDQDASRWQFLMDGVVMQEGVTTAAMRGPSHIIVCMQVGGQWWYNQFTGAGGVAANDYDCDPGPYYLEVRKIRTYTGLTNTVVTDPVTWPSGSNQGTSVSASTTQALMDARGRPLGFTTINSLQYSLSEMAFVHGTTTRGVSHWIGLGQGVNGSGYGDTLMDMNWFKGVMNIQFSLCGEGLFNMHTQAEYDAMMIAQANGANYAKWFDIGVTFAMLGRTADDTILDIAHEQFGTWYIYSPVNIGTAVWINAFRAAVTAFRAGYASKTSAKPPRFSWGGGVGPWTAKGGSFAVANVMETWPGKAYVDVINVHFYDSKAYPATADWTQVNWLNGLKNITDYAVANNIPVCCGEWNIMSAPAGSVGGDQRVPAPAQDNALYIRLMYNWMKYLADKGLFAGESMFTDYSGTQFTKYLWPNVNGGNGQNTAAWAEYLKWWKKP